MLKRALLASLLCLFAIPAVAQTALETAASALRPGSWVELTTTAMDATFLNMTGSSGHALGYNDDLEYDPATATFFFIGSDHNVASQFSTYDVTANTWQTLTRPSWMPDPMGTLNGTMHGYDHSAIDVTGRYYYHREAATFNIHRYNIDTQVWDSPAVPMRSTTNPPWGDYTSFADGVDFFPELGGLVWAACDGTNGVNTSHVYLLDNTDTWSLKSSTLDMNGTYCVSAYNPVYHVMIFYAALTDHFYKIDSSGTITTITNPPFTMYTGSLAYTSLKADPVTGQYIALSADDRDLYSYDVPTDHWAAITSLNKPTMTLRGVVATGVSDMGVIFYATCNNSACHTYIYKHSDFQARCAASGVVRCVGFDDAADIAGGYSDNTGIIVGAAPNGSTPQLDTVEAASGASSLMMTIASMTSADTSGSYWANFSPDLLTQFGEGDDFYIQWRQRFSSAFLSTAYTDAEGWKQTIIGEGDHYMGALAFSCTQLEVVTINNLDRGFPMQYHSCGGKDGHFEPLEEFFPPSDFKEENARAAPYCLYSQGLTMPTTFFPPSGNCFAYVANEWMTFQVHIHIGTWYQNDMNYHQDSTIDLWAAREGQPSEAVIHYVNYDIANQDPTAKYGKVWLTPYNTNKSASQSHATAYTWYDELIISTNRIADPLVANFNTPVAGGGSRLRMRLH